MSDRPYLRVVGYEIEIRPCCGLWRRFEGRVVQLVQSSGAPEPYYRHHYLPDHGASEPYWMRSRSRERIQRKLREAMNRQRCHRPAPEVIPLSHTERGWQ